MEQDRQAGARERDAAWEWAKAQPQAPQAGGQARAEAAWGDSVLGQEETACARAAGRRLRISAEPPAIRSNAQAAAR